MRKPGWKRFQVDAERQSGVPLRGEKWEGEIQMDRSTVCWLASVVVACMITFSPAHARDEAALPESVATAWERYLAASQSGDSEAAGDAVLEAHRAAEAEGVDPLTRAILADTAGQFAYVRSAFSDARAMLGLAADLFGELGESQKNNLVRVQRLIAEAFFLEEQHRDVLHQVDAVLASAGATGADPERDSDVAAALALRARAHWALGSITRAGGAAREALDVIEPYGLESHASAPLMAFYQGVDGALRRRHHDSAWWFAVAGHLFGLQEQGNRLITITDVWSRYARSRLNSAQRRDLIVRLAEAGFLTEPEREAAEAEADEEEQVETAVPDPLNRSARPIRRTSPTYPSAAAGAGVEGITLITFTVTAEGRVADADVVFSAPHPVFGEAALRAMRRWRYEPKLVDGVPTAHEGVRTTFDFRMQDELP
ncbi:MAG: energy transducer TonB [Oceanicaulis sp.]|nr:energy transducer TonB [Oceanicaulis sp.]